MNGRLLNLLFESWNNEEGNVNDIVSIMDWVSQKNRDIEVSLKKEVFGYDDNWLYSKDRKGIVHKSGYFFSIVGLVEEKMGVKVKEQPIILQSEIGYLGIICKEIDGILNFLMQAKIEPGNVNKVQISPTIQATKSNFMQVHGGRKPAYLDYFKNKSKYDIIVDQIQSEHSGFFLGKRNRNIIIKVDEEVEVTPNHRWLTLGQIKRLMRYDNLVNMDTRTVISCIPYNMEILDSEEAFRIVQIIKNKALWKSMNSRSLDDVTRAYQYLNDYKMMNSNNRRIVDLNELETWKFNDDKTEFLCENQSSFKIIYCSIGIEGREVRYWTQPLIKTFDVGIIGLFRCVDHGILKYLVHAVSEIGCFDGIEIGPTLFMEDGKKVNNAIEELFLYKLSNSENVVMNRLFSEEGGRFYHGENRNVIIEIQKEEVEITDLSYMWMDFRSLNRMIQANNCLNIYLRDLISLQEL